MAQEITTEPLDLSACRENIDAYAATGDARSCRDIGRKVIRECVALRAQVQRIRDLANRMESESPKPGPGGFLAEALRDELDKES